MESIISNSHEVFDKLSTAQKQELLSPHNAILCKAKNLVKGHSDWEQATIKLWFETRNPHLGNISPLFMIAFGRGEKLIQWIESQLEGNLP